MDAGMEAGPSLFAGAAYAACAVWMVALAARSFGLAGFAAGRRLLVLQGAAALWTGCYAAEIWLEDPVAMRAATELAYVGVAFAPVAWALCVLNQGRRAEAVPDSVRALLWAEATTVAILALSNEAHGLVWTGFVRTAESVPSLLEPQPGPVFQLHGAVACATFLTAAVALERRLRCGGSEARRDTTWLVASLLPLILTIALHFAPAQLQPRVDLGPLAFSLSAFLVHRTVRRVGLGAIGPTASGAVLSDAPDPVFTLDRAGRIVDQNQAATAFEAPGRPPLLGQRFADAFAGHDELCRWLSQEDPGPAELNVMVRSERRRFVGRVHEIRSAGGQAEGRIIVLQDVTILNEAIFGLHAAEARHRAILRLAPDCIAVLDEDGRILDVNPATERTFGLPPGGAIGRPAPEALAPEALGRAGGLVRVGMDADVRWRETEARRTNGETFPAETAITSFELEGERYYVGFLRDISQRREVERLRDQIVATVSHEMRTPLTSILGFAELLVDRELPEGQRQQYLEVIVGEAGRLSRLIEDLLELKTLQVGALHLHVARLDLAELLRRTAERLPPPRREAVDLDLLGRARVQGDGERLEQVVLNLLSNAAKFSPTGGRIRVSARTRGEEAVVTVRDSGPGIAPEALEQVFEPFYRTPGALERRVPGTGLGLALVKQVIEAHGGRVFAERPPEGGGCVGFALPISD
jgi:PAS domain S-box-containing protein